MIEMNTHNPIKTLDLFRVLDSKLLELLSGLPPNDWGKVTLASPWTVKDVAAHLLDGNIRTLSMLRDGYFGKKAPETESYRGLINYLNELNAEWVLAMKRVSPPILMQLLDQTGKEYADYLATLPPNEKAVFSVAWAGEEESQNWFHIAREYTEKWHHQQQIRFAVGGQEELYAPGLFRPYLETSLRALPHHYRNWEEDEGTALEFVITGDEEYRWLLCREPEGWILRQSSHYEPVCRVEISQDIVWRIFSKGITPEEATKQVKITGRSAPGLKIVDMLAVMA